MPPKIVHTIFTAVLATAIVANAATEDFATAMLNATYKLFHKDSTGTCFLVRRSADDRNLYLVTAAHVLERTQGDTAIIVLRELRDDGSYKRRDLVISVRREDKALWTRHPVQDIAVLRLTQPMPVPAASLPLASIADEARLEKAGLHICSGLYLLTYPQRFEANDAGFAIARQGIIASHPFLPIHEYSTYFADFTTFAGDSGGPVFVAGSESEPLLIGIVLAQSRHDEQIKTEYEERTIHHPLGLGTVLHAQFVRDVIEQAAKQASP